MTLSCLPNGPILCPVCVPPGGTINAPWLCTFPYYYCPDQAADNYAGLYGRAIGNSVGLRWRMA